MSKTGTMDDEAIRMNVFVYKDEHPLLYAELQKLKKGVRRVQRLKTLASEGLLLGGMAGPIPAHRDRHGNVAAENLADEGAAAPSQVLDEDERAAVDEFFAPPIKG